MRYPLCTAPTTLLLLFSACAAGASGDDDDCVAPECGGSPDAGGAADADDSQAVCGNGVREGSELCDGTGCPVACNDGAACTVDTLTGSAAACTAACQYTALTTCSTASDGCCPTGCTDLTDADCLPYGIDAYYDDQYSLTDLGPATGVPNPYGCLMIDPADPNRLLLGGAANGPSGVLYALPITRDSGGHITGFAGPATTYAMADYNDGGIAIGPDGVLFLARWPVNGVGQYKPGSAAPDRIDDMAALGVASAAASLMFVPPTHPGAGALKLMSWSAGQWYEMTMAPDGAGTFAISAAGLRTTLAGGPEGMAYIPLGSPLVPQPSVVVSEFSAGEVSIYEVDAAGDPAVATRRRFVYGLQGAEGASIDPVSGDFMFSTFGTGTDRVVVVRGFVPPVID